MGRVEYLDLDDPLGLIRMLGIGPVRDVGLLDSALARPRSSTFGEDAYPTTTLKSAALLHSIVNNHVLVDGNKRLAWFATVVSVNSAAFLPTYQTSRHLTWYGRLQPPPSTSTQSPSGFRQTNELRNPHTTCPQLRRSSC